jgi:hypothetical protein
VPEVLLPEEPPPHEVSVNARQASKAIANAGAHRKRNCCSFSRCCENAKTKNRDVPTSRRIKRIRLSTRLKGQPTDRAVVVTVTAAVVADLELSEIMLGVTVQVEDDGAPVHASDTL